MSASGRWFRVNTTWSQSEWLAVLSPAARLTWIELLAYVKAHGYDGRVRAPSALIFARTVGIPVEDVRELLDAAQADDALRIEDGHWILTGWEEHQGDATVKERVRRHREKRKAQAAAGVTGVTDDTDVTDVTRYERNVTPTKTKTSTKTEEQITTGAAAPDFAPVVAKRNGGANGTLTDDDRLSGADVLRAWLDTQTGGVPKDAKAKQAGCAKRLAERHTAPELAAAFVGMEQLFPHSRGEPWDLFDLERKFVKALAKARDHPAIRQARDDAEFDRILDSKGYPA
jgi:hypothetical protein